MFVINASRSGAPSQFARCLLAAGSCLLLSACSDQLATYPVTGRVQFAGGEPVRVGKVEFTSRAHGLQARGEIDADGRFTLSTYVPGDGAVAGLHDCVVVQMVLAEGAAGPRPTTIGVVDRRHADYASSGLSAEVLPQADNSIVLEVQGLRATQPAEHSHSR